MSWMSGGSRTEIVLGSSLSFLASAQFKVYGGFSSLLVVCLYHCVKISASKNAKLVYVRSEEVLNNPARKKLAETIEKIIEKTNSLSQPQYVPTFWAANTWPNVILLMIKQRFDRKFRNNFKRDTLTMPDGGTVSVDWPLQDDTLPDDAPIVIFLHTVTGSSSYTCHYTREAAARGWRSCVFNRRGHGGMRLTSPKFNLMGDAEDTVKMVDHVVSKYPRTSFIGMVGISAGSGLLITYLGKQGDKTPVQAACSLCPAWDVSQAFKNLRKYYPTVDDHLLESVNELFLKKNFKLLNDKFPKVMKTCSQSIDVQQFFDSHYPFAGFDTSEAYYEDSNPMNWVDGILRPTLLINSEDDMVCLPENIREDVVLDHGGALLLRTERGSHIAYNEGLFGQGNYLTRVSMDFLESARLVDAKAI